MISRRKFIKNGVATGVAISAVTSACQTQNNIVAGYPLLLSTWKHGLAANKKGLEIINNGGSSLDAVEKGVMVVEADPDNLSVGLGGLPDRDGKVTLDACIMNKKGEAGSVCFLEHIKHPISVARMVMEKTPHVMLAGSGALEFALSQGFKKENLLTEKATEAWNKWKLESKYKPIINIENHDTIGMLAIDKKGDIAGACTTSGLAYKMHGRVGDSPVIGAGMYIDNEIGGATATGMGELVLTTLGSFLVVELMRQGASPNEACKEAVQRIIKKHDVKELQVGYIACNKSGEYGGYSIHGGFDYAVTQSDKHKLIDATSHF